MNTSALQAARLVLARDLQLAFRKRAQFIQPLAFFAIVTTLFPLSISPELSRLREIASGVLWVAALLASLLALEFLFRDDAHDAERDRGDDQEQEEGNHCESPLSRAAQRRASRRSPSPPDW